MRLQGGGEGVSSQEEGVRSMSGKSSADAGGTEQATHHGAQIAQGALLSQGED